MAAVTHQATVAAGGRCGLLLLLRAARGGGSAVRERRPSCRRPPGLLLPAVASLGGAGRAAGLVRNAAAGSGSTRVLLAPGAGGWRRGRRSSGSSTSSTASTAAARSSGSASGRGALPLLPPLLSPRLSAVAAPESFTRPSVAPVGRLERRTAIATPARSALLLLPPRLALACLAYAASAVVAVLLQCCRAVAIGIGACATPTSGAGHVVGEPMVGCGLLSYVLRLLGGPGGLATLLLLRPAYL